MKIFIRHAYLEPIRPPRCVLCRDADATHMMVVAIRFEGTPVSAAQDVNTPCCARCEPDLFKQIEETIQKQDKEREP